jgi:hypothetical protein
LPDPLAGLGLNQPAPSATPQLHPALAVTVTRPLTLLAGKFCEGGEIE